MIFFPSQPASQPATSPLSLLVGRSVALNRNELLCLFRFVLRPNWGLFIHSFTQIGIVILSANEEHDYGVEAEEEDEEAVELRVGCSVTEITPQSLVILLYRQINSKLFCGATTYPVPYVVVVIVSLVSLLCCCVWRVR